MVRTGLPFWRSLNLYHALLTISWPSFYAIAVAAYLLSNLVFAITYMLCGPNAIAGVTGTSFSEQFLD